MQNTIRGTRKWLSVRMALVLAGTPICREFSHTLPDEREIKRTGRQEYPHVFLDDECEINYIVVVMKTPASLGELEQVVLLAILRLGKDAYGVTIRSEIAKCTGRDLSPGALYTTLDRMEEKGIVRSSFGEATPQRGGRAKRYFTLTKAGRSALVNVQRAYQSLLEGLDLLGGAHACSINC